jgi:hypothetical protein
VSQTLLMQVSLDTFKTDRARMGHWKVGEWEWLSLLDFNMLPGSLAAIQWSEPCTYHHRKILKESVEGYRLWMTTYFGAEYHKSLQKVIDWLGEEATFYDFPLDALFLRAKLEAMVCGWNTDVRERQVSLWGLMGPYATLLPIALMEAHGAQALTKVATDPYPYHTFAVCGERAALALPPPQPPGPREQQAMQAQTGPQSQRTRDTGPQQGGGTQPAAATLSLTGGNGVCPWHLTKLMGLNSYGCSKTSICTKAHGTLNMMTMAAAARGVQELERMPKRQQLFNDASAWVVANSSKFRPPAPPGGGM